MNSILVKAEWDAEASVWVATSDDVAGLAAEAPTLEKLRQKMLPMISDLIELNVSLSTRHSGESRNLPQN